MLGPNFEAVKRTPPNKQIGFNANTVQFVTARYSKPPIGKASAWLPVLWAGSGGL